MLQLRSMMLYCSIILSLVQLWSTRNALAQDAGATKPQRPPQRSLRLPNSTFPLRYHLHISSNIHLADLKYTGNVTIDIAIRESTHELVMHAKNLSDFQIRVWEMESGELFDDLTFSYDEECSFLIIHPVQQYQAFEAGQVLRVEILFSAVMHQKTHGLYWTTYKNNNNNKTVYLAATQSEPSYARLVFPCYDEPGFKSNFTIVITHGRDYMAISNMHVKHLHEHSDGELTTTHFHPTPPMCTYLVAFVISNFEYITEDYRGVTQRIYTVPDTEDKGYKALKNAVRTLAAFEDYFGIPYPLTKLDHIALNKNYGAAMENWGLITYKEDNLINQDRVDAHKQLKDVLTQNHEIAHQWFGNLVSPEWWTYAWLNEGFATYFSYIITDMLYPELKVMEFFLKDIAERAFSYSHISVRPMTYYVERENDILGVFDIISYQRAACVIKMFHHAFNGKTFVRGIHRYLNKFEYTVANELKLFESIQLAVQEDDSMSKQSWIKQVPDIMLSWTHTESIPIVRVQRNYERNTIVIRQQSKDFYAHEFWWIPLNFATTASPEFEKTHAEYFMPPVANVTLSHEEVGLNLAASDWLILNKQQTGFYHVLYDDANLMAIAKQLQRNHSVIHPVNRAAIFQDLGPLIEHNNLQSVDVIFELLKYLEFEEDLIPWNFVADTLQFFGQNLYSTSSHLLYQQFVQRLVTPLFRRLHLQAHSANFTNTELLARQKIMELACMADLRECIDHTHQLAKEYIFQSVKFQTSIDYYGSSDMILCLGLKYLTDEEFDTILNLLAKADRESLWYDDLIYSLRCTQSRKHLRQYLNVLLGENSTHVIMNDSESMMYLFYLYKANRAARPVVWHFFERNYRVLCRSPFFAENFNRIAEYVPQRYRGKFVQLREMIAIELQEEGFDPNTTLITADSHRIGKKAKTSETFLAQFESHIHDWLMREQSPTSYASIADSSRSAAALRSGTVLHWAGRMLRRALSVTL